jgi:2-polyprenyl-6-methoxyphenol hydroxylase-like FAD-dependent oxidoreductase
MAIEDAVVLARAIALADDAPQAFARFHRQRTRRTTRIVRLSRWWGRVGLWRHPGIVALRNGAIRCGPDGWLERAGAAQYCYDPGNLPGSPTARLSARR